MKILTNLLFSGQNPRSLLHQPERDLPTALRDPILQRRARRRQTRLQGAYI